MHNSASRQSYHRSIPMYAAIAIPVSKISVVNFLIPSTQSSTSRIALVMTLPAPSSRSCAQLLCTRLPYNICFMFLLTLLENLLT